jgi:hypothetical protein
MAIDEMRWKKNKRKHCKRNKKKRKEKKRKEKKRKEKKRKEKKRKEKKRKEKKRKEKKDEERRRKCCYRHVTGRRIKKDQFYKLRDSLTSLDIHDLNLNIEWL